MAYTNINLGCGSVFIDSHEWLNLDFTPASPAVKKANLLARLPVASSSISVIYSSHFLEHVPRDTVPGLLDECLRVLQSGGVLRLVLPDLENIAREYLAMRDAGSHEMANFVVLEMIDQCVRHKTGGELGWLYRQLRAQSDGHAATMIDYIRHRVGEDIAKQDMSGSAELRLRTVQRLPAVLRRVIEYYWIRLCLFTLPRAFRLQNVSLASVGERHQWLWDFHQLKTTLESVGFIDVVRLTAGTSKLVDFPFYPLDLDMDGFARKGAESMYVEARKC